MNNNIKLILTIMLISLLSLLHHVNTLNTHIDILEAENSLFKSRFGKSNTLLNTIQSKGYIETDNSTLDQRIHDSIPSLIDDKYAELINNYGQTNTKYEKSFGYSAINIDDEIYIWSITPNTPAANSNLSVGDKIQSINYIPFNKVDQSLLKFLNTKVDYQVLSVITQDNETIDIALRKANVYHSTSRISKLDNQTLLIKLESFKDTSHISIIRELNKKKHHNIKNLIIDLRSNNGGQLLTAKYLLDLFVHDTVLFAITDKNNNEEVYSPENKYEKLNYNLILLVDRKTASAAELFTSVLQEKANAIVIGEQTFGKGIAQSVVQLNESQALVLTTREVYSSINNKYNQIGVTPDIIVESRPWITPEVDEALTLATDYIYSN